MKIVSLTAENIKKLVAVEIKPDGNVVQITGKNGAGKTSVLDSIFWALAGTSNIQKAPIRTGADSARIKLDLGEIVVTRIFRHGKDGDTTSAIMVENADGSRFSSPQTMLDGLLGHLSFDPLAFARMDAKSQFDTLRRFVPDVDFEKIDMQNKSDYARRTELNRKAKELRSASANIATLESAAPEPVDESGLIDQLEEAGNKNADIETRKSNRVQAKIRMEAKRNEAKDLRSRAQELVEKAYALETEATTLETQLQSAPPLSPPVDVTAIRQKIEQAKQINEQAALHNRKAVLIKEAAALEMESESITEIMEVRETDKREKIAKAKLPVKGISFGDGVVLLNNVPFDQASDAEQLRASIAIAMAANPKLRVIRVRDGSLLDEDSMNMIEDMAKSEDYQVWVERVDGSGKVGFVLEDGSLKK